MLKPANPGKNASKEEQKVYDEGIKAFKKNPRDFGRLKVSAKKAPQRGQPFTRGLKVVGKRVADAPAKKATK